MKQLLLLSLLALPGCYKIKSEAEISAEREARAQLERQAEVVRVSKEEPAGCRYLQAISVEEGNNLFPVDYDGAVRVLRVKAFKAGANVAVIDSAIPPSAEQWAFRLSARAFVCP